MTAYHNSSLRRLLGELPDAVIIFTNLPCFHLVLDVEETRNTIINMNKHCDSLIDAVFDKTLALQYPFMVVSDGRLDTTRTHSNNQSTTRLAERYLQSPHESERDCVLTTRGRQNINKLCVVKYVIVITQNASVSDVSTAVVGRRHELHRRQSDLVRMYKRQGLPVVRTSLTPLKEGYR